MNLDDTIVAVSSPPGPAVRGIVRLSGPEAMNIAEGLFESADGVATAVPLGAPSPPGVGEGSTPPSPSHVEGRIAVGRSELPAAMYVFRAPRSYTRQDVVEIHLIGAPAILGMVMEACMAAGARRAEPGEFTARAYLAGAFDLSQVHGIAGMIAARSDLQLRAAERLLHGALSEKANQAREELADLLSLVEGALDFADEPIEFITPIELRSRLGGVLATLESTAAAGLRAERWGQLPRVMLVGPPNVGKSSLLNRLTGMDRAICAPIAGTTRDVLSAPMTLGETECLLIDMAGLDESSDEVNLKARAVAERATRTADLILRVFDVNAFDTLSSGGGNAPLIVVGNKCDTIGSAQRAKVVERLAATQRGPVCLTSASTGEGCEELSQAIENELHDRPTRAGDAAIALMAEHRKALEEAVEALRRAIELAQRNADGLEEADLVAVELRAAAHALATLVGMDYTEDLLGRIFSRFCVGK